MCKCQKRPIMRPKRPAIWKQRPIIWQKRLYNMTKETYNMAKKTYWSAGTPKVCASVKRDLFTRQNRPIYTAKETYFHGKRGLMTTPTHLSKTLPQFRPWPHRDTAGRQRPHNRRQLIGPPLQQCWAPRLHHITQHLDVSNCGLNTTGYGVY